MYGIAIHHTASNASPEADMHYMWVVCPEGPVGAIYLGRDGRIVIGAAGATNCQGNGGPLTTSKGTIPLNQGNRYMIAIEAAATGSEPWPTVQQDRYVALVRALCDGYGLDPQRDVYGHFDYCAPSCPGRKIDPAGPSRFGSVNAAGTWDIRKFRAEVGPVSPPQPTPTPPGEEDDLKLYLVLYPGSPTQYVTDLATFKTPISTPDVAADGVTHFGWIPQAAGTADPWRLGPNWAAFLDRLPSPGDR